jgi:hypothetical protein
MDNILEHPKLLPHRNCRKIPENWLELEIFNLLGYPVKLDKFELYDENNERLCICEFIKRYENNTKFTGYFSKPIFCNYDSKIFGFRSRGRESEESVSVSSQAYKFFSEDKTPIQVAIALNLREDQVTELYKEYWDLNNLHGLSQIYEKIKGDIVSFLHLYNLAKAAGMNAQ